MGLLDILGYVGETLDKPGAALRGTLAGRPDQLLNLLPFSDTMGITDPSTRVSGRDLLEQYNLLAENTPGLDWGDAAGFVVEEGLDPLNWIPGGFLAKQGLKGAGRLGSAMGGMMGMARRLPSWSDDVEGILPRLAEQEVMDLDTDWALEAKRMNMIPPAHQADQMGTVFEPDDVQGMYDQYLAMNPAPAYYSRLDKAAQGLPEHFKVDSLQNLLRRAPEGFAKEEWDWRNMQNFSDSLRGKMSTREELLKFLNNNPLEITPNAVAPKFQHYVAAKDALEGGPENGGYLETLMQWSPETRQYISPHFQGNYNPLLHVRSTSRPNPLGEGTMRFADEIQSDWHQAGRQHGYGVPETYVPPEITRRELGGGQVALSNGNLEYTLVERADGSVQVQYPDGRGSLPYRNHAEAEEAARAALNQHARYSLAPRTVRDAPLKEDWPRLGFKELLRQAIDDNAQAAGWTTGGQIQGLVGGGIEGQKQFYDQQLLNIAKKYLKQWGVEPQPFGARGAPRKVPEPWELEDLTDNLHLTNEQIDELISLDDPQAGQYLDDQFEGFGFPITDRMRRDILSKGQPLLSVMPWLAAALGGGAAASRMGQGEPSVY